MFTCWCLINRQGSLKHLSYYSGSCLMLRYKINVHLSLLQRLYVTRLLLSRVAASSFMYLLVTTDSGDYCMSFESKLWELYMKVGNALLACTHVLSHNQFNTQNIPCLHLAWSLVSTITLLGSATTSSHFLLSYSKLAKKKLLTSLRNKCEPMLYHDDQYLFITIIWKANTNSTLAQSSVGAAMPRPVF